MRELAFALVFIESGAQFLVSLNHSLIPSLGQDYHVKHVSNISRNESHKKPGDPCISQGIALWVFHISNLMVKLC